MAKIYVTSSTPALKAAAEIFAAAVRVISGRYSRRIPAETRSYLGPGSHSAFVAAGHAGGKWGWTPIHAWMFDPNPGSDRATDPKHPLFGNRKLWYSQPRRPFLEEGADAGIDQAMKVYADISIAKWRAQGGFK